MISPEYLEQCPDRLTEIYEQAERDIIADMARKLNKYDYFSSASEWQAKKLQEMGLTYKEIQTRLAKASGKSKSEIVKLLKEAGTKELSDDGVEPTQATIDVLNAGLDKTLGTFDNLTKTTAIYGSRQISEALDRVYMQVTSGAFSQEAAIKNAITELAKKGIEAYVYGTRKDYIDVVVRRAVRTGVNQTVAKISLSNADQLGTDLVEVSAHSGARPTHAEWQGKVFSISGKTKGYEKLSEATGYGTVTGLCGANCRHTFYPFMEGDEPAYTEEELQSYDEPKYTYNGHKMTEYVATQRQRYIERQIRRYKREKAGMQAAELPTEESQAKIKKWEEIQADFLSQTGLKRQVARENVPKTEEKIASFTFKEAPNAIKTTKTKLKVMSTISNTSQTIIDEMHNTTIQVGGGVSAYDYKRDIMYIANGVEENEIHHEIGHLIESKILSKEKVSKLKEKIFDKTTFDDIIFKTMYQADGTPVDVLIVKNDKLVSEYQGRIYVKHLSEAFDADGMLRYDKLLEFVSEPYRKYKENPDIFKRKYPDFYELIKEAVEDESSGGISKG